MWWRSFVRIVTDCFLDDLFLYELGMSFAFGSDDYRNIFKIYDKLDFYAPLVGFQCLVPVNPFPPIPYYHLFLEQFASRLDMTFPLSGTLMCCNAVAVVNYSRVGVMGVITEHVDDGIVQHRVLFSGYKGPIDLLIYQFGRPIRWIRDIKLPLKINEPVDMIVVNEDINNTVYVEIGNRKIIY